jgi:hypothetical protein
MIYNLKNRISIDKFSRLYDESDDSEMIEETSKKVVYLQIKVNDTVYTYKTVQNLFEDQTWYVWFLTSKNERFFEIMIEDTDTASCDIFLKNKKTDIQCITLNGILLTPLETTFYLRTFYCEMLGVTYVKIQDVANSVCKGDFGYQTMYFLIPYRIFAKNDLKLKDISIYSKFYKYKRNPIFTNDDETVLEKYRNMKIPESIVQLIKFYKLHLDLDTNLSIFFKNFLDDINCGKYATLLNSVNLLLLQNQDYQDLYNKIKDYTVKNRDSIYYQNSYQFKSHRSKSKKRKKSTKKKKSIRVLTNKKH